MDRVSLTYGSRTTQRARLPGYFSRAEEHAVAGKRATSQAQRAFALAFTHRDQAADEIDLGHQLLTGLVLRVTTATAQIAELIRDAGTTSDIEDRAERLRTASNSP
ncbi:hypothetical protein [Streptomyces deserti]